LRVQITDGKIEDFSKAIRRQANCPDTQYIGYCAVFKVREEVQLARRSPGPQRPRAPAASRSLKTQQHASRITWV